MKVGICKEYEEIIKKLLCISSSYEKCKEIGIVEKLATKVDDLEDHEKKLMIERYGKDNVPKRHKIAPAPEEYFPAFLNYLEDIWKKTNFKDLNIKEEFTNLMNEIGNKEEAFIQLTHCIYKLLEKDEYFYPSLRITRLDS